MRREKRCGSWRTLLQATLAAMLLAILPASFALGELAEQPEMKKQAPQQIERGKVPQNKPVQSFGKRDPNRKGTEKTEQEEAARRLAPQPPGTLPPSPRERPKEHDKEKSRDHRDHVPTYHPFEHHQRDDKDHPHSDRHDADWRWQRCRRFWGSGWRFHRCLNGDEEFLHPRRHHDTTIILEGPPAETVPPEEGPSLEEGPPAETVPPEEAPPQAVPYVNPDNQEDLRADRYPEWYGARLSGEAVVTAEDESGNSRSFHLVGISPSNDPDFTASCIAYNLGDRTVRINEVGQAGDNSGADAEAVIFSGGAIVNLQVLAQGCAEFDAKTCSELGLDFCDAFQEAENTARHNRVGIWQ